MLNRSEFNFLTIEPYTSWKSLGVSNQSAATVKTKVCPPNMTEKCFEYVKRYFLDGVWIAVLTVSGWCLVGVLRQREYCLNSVWIVVSWFDYIRIVGVLNG